MKRCKAIATSSLLFLSVLTTALGPREVLATSMVLLSLDEIASRSSALIRGRVESLRVERDPQGRILTVASIAVAEAAFGVRESEHTVEVTTLGGTLEGVTMTAVGAPRFEIGAEVVLFLDDSAPGRRMVTDLAQGKFEVRREADGRERLTRSDLDEVDLSSDSEPEIPTNWALLRQRAAAARAWRLGSK
jgi:hypothetical protein